MLFKKKNDNDPIGPLTGFSAFLHKVFLFITYPFRKPLVFLILILLLLGAAYAYPILVKGVAPKEVHTWYIERAKEIDISQLPDMLKSPAPEKGTDNLIEVPHETKKVRRQIFEKAADSAPQVVDVLSEERDDVVRIEAVRPPTLIEERVEEASFVSQPVVSTDTDNQPTILKAKDGASLSFLDTAEEIEGEAVVYNGNELEVNGTYVFLHGVYSNPRTERGVRAGVFLKSLLKGQKVRCEILSYTEDKVATAECYIDNVSINNLLVDRGYADRVSLQ